MRSLLYTVLLALLMLAGGFVWFVAGLPREVTDPRTATDAIVVLTGGSDRLATGFELLERGLARKLLISGVGAGAEPGELLRHAGRNPDDFACCLAIGRGADNTIGNARETAAWMRREGLGSLRLVTAQYHMPRSLEVFRQAMPTVLIVPHPVFPESVKHDRWWEWPGTTRLLVNEYAKYLAAVAYGYIPAPHAGNERAEVR